MALTSALLVPAALLAGCCMLLASAAPAVAASRSSHDARAPGWLWKEPAELNPLGIRLANHKATKCAKMLGVKEGKQVSVVMVADPGTWTGHPENAHYVTNLQNARASGWEFTSCEDVKIGKLLLQDAAVITSGIGPVAAGICLQELLQCGHMVKDIVYVGTSGWSAQQGGILSVVPYASSRSPSNDGAKGATARDGCESANPSVEVNRIGDVCISSGTVNWACKMTSFDEQCNWSGDECYLPGQTAGPSASQLYGQCQFTKNSTADVGLAQELKAAYWSAVAEDMFPQRKAAISDYETKFWDVMENGTGIGYVYSPDTAPRINTGEVCMEIDSQFFYNGVPWEMTSRQYIADALNRAFNTSLDMTKVTAVGAMEGIGLDNVLTKYNARRPAGEQIPSVNFRGMSNTLHGPVQQAEDGRWSVVPLKESVADGYEYAIATAATTVLQMFKDRCELLCRQQGDSLGGGGKLGLGNLCSKGCEYHVDYSA